MKGFCHYCEKDTEWREYNGWVFHSLARHWRCSVCGTATETHRWPKGALAQLQAKQQQERETREVHRVRLKIKAKPRNIPWNKQSAHSTSRDAE